MLKNLYDLVKPKLTLPGTAEKNSGSLDKKKQELRLTVKEQRTNIDPTDLEIELHHHLEKALIEIDHAVDILGLCAMKTKDECEQGIFTKDARCPVIPEVNFDDDIRTLAIYWRRVERVVEKNEGSSITMQTSRIPISKKNSKDDVPGSYSKHIFAGANSEMKAIYFDIEDRFRALRGLVHSISKMRRTINTMDRLSGEFFDKSIMYETKPRVQTSKPKQYPEEDATYIKY